MPSRNKLNPVLKLTVASGLLAMMLAGCGIRGDLKVPPPIFGESQVDPDRVPNEDLDKEDDFDSDDPLDDNFIDVDQNSIDDDPFEDGSN